MELALLASLATVDGKASTIGFYEAVLARPAAAFERLGMREALESAGYGELAELEAPSKRRRLFRRS